MTHLSLTEARHRMGGHATDAEYGQVPA